MDTCPGSDPTATPPVIGSCSPDPYDNAGNRLWTFPGLVLNPYGALDITATIPAGYTYTVSCTNDDVNLPQTAGCGPAPVWNSNATYRLGRSASHNGSIWRSLVNGPPAPTNKNIIPAEGAFWTEVCTSVFVVNVGDVCATPITANTIFSAANVFHGSSVTFKFTAPDELPCPAGTFEASLNGAGDLVMVYSQFPAPNDNSYGANSVGWDGTRAFNALVGSDKAGFQIKNAAGTTLLSFNMDYLSAKTASASTPSGYASLGPFGGDGDVLIGSLTPAVGIFTTSLAKNLNETGYCTFAPTNCFLVPAGSGGVNLLVNSPPTLNTNSYDPPVGGTPYPAWDFKNIYYATITAAKLAALGLSAADFGGTVAAPGKWTASPNLTVLHNSPDKECPPGPFNCDDITVGNKSFGSKEAKVDVNNISQSQDAFVTGVELSWPQATNGNLTEIKVGGDVIWTGSLASPVNLTLLELTASADKRKIKKNSDEDLKFKFQNNVSTNVADYTGSLHFGDTCEKPILP